MAVEIWLGALAPEAYELVLSADTVGDVDLSTVSEASFSVMDPAGTESEWSATISYDEETEKLTITHVFADGESEDGSELSKAGWWRVFAVLTIPSGTVRSKPRPILVRGKFDVDQET